MNILVTTPISHIPGAIDLIRQKGNVFFAETGSKQEIRNLLISNGIDTIFCNPNQQTYKIDEELLINTNVKLINTCSTGLNHIDIDFCNKNSIEIYSLTTDYKLINELPSTAELAFGLMLSILRNIPKANDHVKSKAWDYTKFVGRQVKDLTIGIIGFGRLGKMMYNYCTAFGMRVLVYDPYKKQEMDDIFLLNQYAELDEIIKQCDVISLHVHVSNSTFHMINEQLLGKCEKMPYIINTSRGEIVKEDDVINALQTNKIAGYATDVLEDEFGNLQNSNIIDAMNNGYNIIITPHIGGMTIEGQTKAYIWAINKL
jgi:D-3-phosphoglycerate dehydrogenase